jgi:hypothetical protein
MEHWAFCANLILFLLFIYFLKYLNFRFKPNPIFFLLTLSIFQIEIFILIQLVKYLGLFWRNHISQIYLVI